MASKQSEFKYYKSSQLTVKVLKWVTIVLSIIGLIRLLLIGTFSRFIHKIGDTIYEKVTANPDGYLNDLFKNPDNVKSWGTRFDDTFMFNMPEFITHALWIIGIIAFIYVLLIMLRHRHGEHAPILNDWEAHNLKKQIIDDLGANRREKEDDESQTSKGKKRKKIKRSERMARKQIRKMNVEIHTRYEDGMPKPYKTYDVQFRRIGKIAYNKILLKKIEGLNEFLTSETGTSFSDRESYGKVYEYRANQQLTKDKESIFVKMRRRSKKKDTGTTSSSEFTFPLDLFVDKRAKIEEQEAKAEVFGKKTQESVGIHLSSKGVYVDESERFIGKTSVNLNYKLPPNVSKLPNNDELQTSIDTTLDVSGTGVKLDGSTLIITIPLPKSCAIPIDMKDMIEKVF